MRNSRDLNDKPSVRLLLAALSWLTNKPRPGDPAMQLAIAHHIHMLVLHPASDSFDVQAAFYMAGKAGMDAEGLLARFSAVATNLH
ncbi:hypothetical protein [Nitrosospira sp. Nsp1]|uniref:hypothetical protein n=1 Tax=Nitrosospira sp. Nsp1 TaxID=136547 RepID=UPI00088B49B4|nr:hypothetical protein [Nitrosospira sp. Nsp1]SCX60935.1 hypothetical protein SAMN05720354_12634 [Nitrosospira sp. Nsp1]